jgi:hypothetical protein
MHFAPDGWAGGCIERTMGSAFSKTRRQNAASEKTKEYLSVQLEKENKEGGNESIDPF